MHFWSVLIYGWVYFGFVDIAELHLEAVKFVPKHKLKGSVFVHLYNTAFGQKQCNLNNVCVYIYKWVTLVLSQFEKKNILAVNSPEKMSMMFIYLVLKMVVVLIVLMTAHNLILKTKTATAAATPESDFAWYLKVAWVEFINIHSHWKININIIMFVHTHSKTIVHSVFSYTMVCIVIIKTINDTKNVFVIYCIFWNRRSKRFIIIMSGTRLYSELL